MLALDLQQFAARGQNMDLRRLLVELLGKQGDRVDHMLAAVENDKKLSRTNELDQLQGGVFRFECKSQGCRDRSRNMARIGKTLQINKIDSPVKLLDSGTTNSQGDRRLANSAGAEQCYEALVPKLGADVVGHRLTANHDMRSHGEPASVQYSIVPALRTGCERDDGADERVTPSLAVCA